MKMMMMRIKHSQLEDRISAAKWARMEKKLWTKKWEMEVDYSNNRR